MQLVEAEKDDGSERADEVLLDAAGLVSAPSACSHGVRSKFNVPKSQ
jgi:hypothetical protein